MRYCSKCGYKLKDDQLYCPKCGNKEPQIKNNKKSSWKSFDAKDEKAQNVNWDFSAKQTPTESEINMPYKAWRMGLGVSIVVVSVLYFAIFIIGMFSNKAKMSSDIQLAILIMFYIAQAIAIADLIQSIVLIVLFKTKTKADRTYIQTFSAVIVLLVISIIFAFVQYYVISITVPATIVASFFMCLGAAITCFTMGKQIKMKKTA